MQVQVFGPNLSDQSKGAFHVHAAGCQDCRNYGPKGRLGGETTSSPESFDTLRELVEDFYGDQIEESEGHWTEYVQDFHVFPCAVALK